MASVGLLCLTLPKLLRYDSSTDPDSLRRRAQQEAAEKAREETAGTA